MAAQLHVVLQFVHAHNLLAFLSQREAQFRKRKQFPSIGTHSHPLAAAQSKAQAVWSAKLSQLAHSKSTAARFAAFALLTRTAATAQHAPLSARLSAWLDLASTAALEAGEPTTHVRGMAAVAMATLLARACRWSDSRRAVAASALGKLYLGCAVQLEQADALDDELFAYWSVALATLLRASPQAARAHAERLERALLRCLGAPSRDKRRRAAACLALLPCGLVAVRVPGQPQQQPLADDNGSGAGAPASVDAHTVLACKLLGLAHDVLDVTFASVVEPGENDELRVEPSAVGAQRSMLGALPEDSGAAVDLLEARFAALCDALSLLFRVEPPNDMPAKRRLPLRGVVALALRVLGVGSVVSRGVRTRRGVNQLDGVPLLARQDVSAALPALHIAALALLDTLLHVAGTRLLPYADAIGDQALAALARSATPRAAAAAALASTASAEAASSTAESGAHFFSEEAAKTAILHAPTRSHAYALAAHLLRVGGAGLDPRLFVAPLLAHAVCDMQRADVDDAANDDRGSRKRKRVKGVSKSVSAPSGGGASDTEAAMASAAASAINLALRDHVSDAARIAAVGIVADLLLHAPLALTMQQKRACAQAVLDVAAHDLLASLTLQSAPTSENTASLVVTRARPETAAMRAALVSALDVVYRRVPAGAAVAHELLTRLTHDPAPAVAQAARLAILRELHIESSIIKMAEAAISVATALQPADHDVDMDDNDDDDEDDEEDAPAVTNFDDDADDDDAIDVPAVTLVAQPAQLGEAPYEEPAEEEEPAEPEPVAEPEPEQDNDEEDDEEEESEAQAQQPVQSAKRARVDAPVARPAAATTFADDGDSDSSSLPDIVVASPDEADLL